MIFPKRNKNKQKQQKQASNFLPLAGGNPKMHRSSRTSIISGETSFSSTSTSSFRGSSSDEIEQHLPTYNPRSHAAKKELSRLRSAQNAIHFIPVVLLLCAVILWFFSNQESKS